MAYHFDRGVVGTVLGQGPKNATVRWLVSGEVEHIPARHLVAVETERCLPRFTDWESAGAHLRAAEGDHVDVVLAIHGVRSGVWRLWKSGVAKPLDLAAEDDLTNVMAPEDVVRDRGGNAVRSRAVDVLNGRGEV